MRILIKVFIKAVLVVFTVTIASGYQSFAQRGVDMKMVRNEAQSLKKRGYKPLPGYPSIENQLLFSHVSMSDYDSDGIPRYVLGGAECKLADSGLEHAIQVAKDNVIDELAGLMDVEIRALNESDTKMVFAPSSSFNLSDYSQADSSVVHFAEGSTVVMHLYEAGEICGYTVTCREGDLSYEASLYNPLLYSLLREEIIPLVGVYNGQEVKLSYMVRIKEFLALYENRRIKQILIDGLDSIFNEDTDVRGQVDRNNRIEQETMKKQ